MAGVRDNQDTAASGTLRGWLTLPPGRDNDDGEQCRIAAASSWAGRPTHPVFSYGINHSSLPHSEAARYSEVTIISYDSLGVPAEGARSCSVDR